MFTSFYSFFNTQFNALLESHFKGKYSEEGTSRVDVWMPLARSLIYRIVLVSILGAMGKFALGLEGDDDRAKYRTVKDPKTGEKKKVEVPKEERFLRVLGKNLRQRRRERCRFSVILRGWWRARSLTGRRTGAISSLVLS